MLISMIEKGCRLGFFGLGLSSTALLEYLPLKNCRVSIRSDTDISWSAIPCGARIERLLIGRSAYQNIDEDIIIFSPSVRRDRAELLEAAARGVIFTSDAEMFFEMESAPIFALTGSDGKSTTATLTNMLLNAGGIRSEVIGNIGRPMLPCLHTADAFVTELSSFMLSYARPRARRGCITNITPNHLDWHKDFEEYKTAKLSLINGCDEAVIPDELTEIGGAYGIVSIDRGYKELMREYDAQLYITLENGYIKKNGIELIAIDRLKRRERHNLKNAMMAIAMTDGYVNKEGIDSVLSGFEGLKHRCEMVAKIDGVECYDSSIDSTPVRTAVTLRSLGRQVILILGGRSKGLDYTTLNPVLNEYARSIIITGENAEEIYEAIEDKRKVHITKSFAEATELGLNLAKDVGALLLSPASTSYDMFRSYAERGDSFKEILLKLALKEN